MRESEFWASVEWAFPGRGESLMQDLVLGTLGDRSPRQALEDGEDAQKVWIAVCKAMDLPESYYYLHRLKPAERDRIL